jgi:hypothetical protein
MANWCENSLIVTGEENEIRRFEKQARPDDGDGAQTALSLERLYPIPKGVHRGDLDIHELQASGKNSWYHWCITHWGTEWDVMATLIDAGKTRLTYEFESAWSPPVAWLVKVGTDFGTLRFRLTYEEPGMGFSGVTVVDRGFVLVDECWRYA